jgi:hypothetical protein
VSRPFVQVRSPYQSLDPAVLLQRPTSVLLGVGQGAAKVIRDIGIETVLDLATSTLLSTADYICQLADNGQGKYAAAGRVPRDALREAHETPITELPNLPIHVLSSSASATKLDGLATALDIHSIRDLSAWPPYRTAREVFSRVNGQAANAPTADMESPPDLVPQNGQYPTERVHYEVLVFDHFVDGDEVGQLTPLGSAGALDLPAYLTDERGYERPAVGGVLTFTQSWYTKGLALGQLIHSIALGPGESTKIAMIDWSRSVRTSARENISEDERLLSDLTRARAIAEITGAVARETQRGESAAHSEANSKQWGEAGGAASLRDLPWLSALTGIISPGVTTSGTSFGKSWGKTDATSWSTSSGERDVSAALAQDIADRTHQASHAARNRRASIVREVSQQESETISTRTLTNYNHMHALTVEHYEVVQLYRTVTEMSKADRCLFVPMKLLDFRRANVIDRYRAALVDVALSPVVREALQYPAGSTRIKAPAVSTGDLDTVAGDASAFSNRARDKWNAYDIQRMLTATGGLSSVLADGRIILPSDAVLRDVEFLGTVPMPAKGDGGEDYFTGKVVLTVNGSAATDSGKKIRQGSQVKVAAAGVVTYGTPKPTTTADYFSGSFQMTVDARLVVDTEKLIKKGSRIQLSAAGRIKVGEAFGVGYDADGVSSAAGPAHYAPGLRELSLIARLGTRWYQGGRQKTFIAADEGVLILQVNDLVGELNNNSGAWEVGVTVTPPTDTTTPATTYDADGRAASAGTSFFAPGLREYSLIARVGTKWHQAGVNREFTADEDGPLLLQPNDVVGDLANNTGAWEVTLEVKPPPATPVTARTTEVTIADHDGQAITLKMPQSGPVGIGRSLRMEQTAWLSVKATGVTSGDVGFLVATIEFRDGSFRLGIPVRLQPDAGVVVLETVLSMDLVSHLQDNRLYYSQAVWRALDPATIGILLSGYTWPMGGKPRPLVEVVDPTPVSIVANYLVLRVSGDDEAERTGWLTSKRIKIGTLREDQVPVPSGGVFAEAVLGRFNSSERLDLTRFWNWQESPIPIQPPDIATIQAGSRRDTDMTVPGQLGTPMLNIVNPPALPDPQGMGAVLAAVQNGNMFRDMSGLAATIGLAQKGMEGAFEGAASGAAQAGTNAAVAAQLAGEVAEAVAQVVAAYLGGGKAGGSDGLMNTGGLSGQGAKINYGRGYDERQESKGAPSGGSGAWEPAEAGAGGTGTVIGESKESNAFDRALGSGGGGSINGLAGQLQQLIMGAAPAAKKELTLKQKVPDKDEKAVVGAIAAKIVRGTPEFASLIKYPDSDIVFKNEEGTDADLMMTSKLRDKLKKLAGLVSAEWPGKKLRVTEAWDESSEHAATSTHYEGRGADITVDDVDSAKLGRLGQLAVDAGLDWVFYENDKHVHVSMKK